MSNADALAVVVGIVMPVLVSFLKNAEWDKRAKFAFTIVISVVLGFATQYFLNALVFQWDKALVDAALVFSASQAVYKLWFEDTTVDARLTG